MRVYQVTIVTRTSLRNHFRQKEASKVSIYLELAQFLLDDIRQINLSYSLRIMCIDHRRESD